MKGSSQKIKSNCIKKHSRNIRRRKELLQKIRQIKQELKESKVWEWTILAKEAGNEEDRQ